MRGKDACACGGVYLFCGYDDDGWFARGVENRADGSGNGRDDDREVD